MEIDIPLQHISQYPTTVLYNPRLVYLQENTIGVDERHSGIEATALHGRQPPTHKTSLPAHESYQANQLSTCTFFISYAYSYNNYKLFLRKPNLVKNNAHIYKRIFAMLIDISSCQITILQGAFT